MKGADPTRDRETVRRALRAAGIGWLVASLLLWLLGALTLAPSLAALPALAAIGLVLGALVGAAWLVLAALLDVLAGEPPGLRRWAWTAGLVLTAAFAGPAALGLATLLLTQ